MRLGISTSTRESMQMDKFVDFVFAMFFLCLGVAVLALEYLIFQ